VRPEVSFAYVVEQPLRRLFHQIKNVLELVGSSGVRVGDFPLGGAEADEEGNLSATWLFGAETLGVPMKSTTTGHPRKPGCLML
jgi:hypothetical protein